MSNSSNTGESRQILPGLTFIAEEGDRWRVEATDVTILVGALTEPILVGFVRCFATVDRLMTLTDMMSLNYEHVGGETIRGERNLNTLAMLVAGLIFEFGEAFQSLEDANIRARLRPGGLERWTRLTRFRELENRLVVSRIRNLLAFHTGDPQVVRRGIRHLTENPRTLRVTEGQGPLQLHGRHDFAGDIIMAGIRVRDVGADASAPSRPLEESDLELAYTETRDAHYAVLNLLEDVWLDALAFAGADVDPLRPLAEQSDQNDL